MQLPDPIAQLLSQHSYNPAEIDQLVIGQKYLACLLKNGHLGICARLNTPCEHFKTIPSQVDQSRLCDRVLLNAYFNALLNPVQSFQNKLDIFDLISFDQYSQIVMIGYFPPLVEKFNQQHIPIKIFDLATHHPGITALNQQMDAVTQADAIILTATTIFNKSFVSIVTATKMHSHVYLLGPSSIMDPFMFQYPNVKAVFGMIFPEKQHEIMKLIENGHGTRVFGKLAQKVNI